MVHKNLQKKYKIIDHIADIGIKVQGNSLKDIYENSAYALFDIISDIKSIQPLNRRKIIATGENKEYLLVSWLSELLYIFDTKKMLFSKFEIKNLTKSNISADIFGEPYVKGKHILKCEIKAITYHQLEIKQSKAKKVLLKPFWEAQVIFDV
ncbi:MAG: archease [Candidatus Firestonebacteria bacterium]